jgi:glycosyltransferase involved in cell wall biosynthesis
VLDQGSGILLQARTPSAFADAAQSLLDDPERRSDIVRRARRRVETVFSVESTARAVEHVYRHVLRQTEATTGRRYRDVL